MRIVPLGAASGVNPPVQLVLAVSEQQTTELRPGDQLEGQVLRMVDQQAQVQIGDTVLTVRSSVPLVPGRVVLQVEDQLDGEWRLKLLSNEPSLYLVRDQITELRLQPDATREMLMKALLGRITVDRETFLQAEQLWKSMERGQDWLPALVQLLKSGEEMTETALRGMRTTLEQSDSPGWLQQQAQDSARQLLQTWQMPETPERMQLLSALIQGAPDFGEVNFSLQRWLAEVELLRVAAESGTPAQATAGQTLEYTSAAAKLTETEALFAAETARANIMDSTGLTERVDLGTRELPLAPRMPASIFYRGSVNPAATGRSSAQTAFRQLEQIWNDAGQVKELLPALIRLFYSEQPLHGKNLLIGIAENESRLQFAELELSELEMGDKRSLLRQMGLADKPERLVLLERLNRGNYHRTDREELLQAERLWRHLGGKERDLESVARVVAERLPMEISSAWAVQLAGENRWQNAFVYLWLNVTGDAQPEACLIHPEEEKPSNERQEHTPQPLVMIGFQTDRLGPVLLSVTPQNGGAYSLQLAVHQLWQREIEREALSDLAPRLRAILPQVRWQVVGLKEQAAGKAELRKPAPTSKRRFDFRV